MKLCHHCGHEVQLLSGIQRTDGCATCYSDLKVCLNCRFFDPGMNNQCREPQAEWVTDKAKANFCEFFEYLEVAGGPPGLGGSGSDKDRARDAFNSLFRKR
jgi:hypothetical protein